MNLRALLLILISLSLSACNHEHRPGQKPPTGQTPVTAQAPSNPKASKPTGHQSGCRACHQYPEAVHAGLVCTACHGGHPEGTTAAAAHANLLAAPGDPEHLQAQCGPCHAKQTATITGSRHFTLTGEINPVRRHFGAGKDLATAREIPVAARPDTLLALTDDLLRRRCMGCHVYSRGDDFAATRHGTGCAACHLEYQGGKLISHSFLATPGDNQCLACHYGNRVGSDYYGSFAHDLRKDYRTPFQTDGAPPERSYGLEQHRLQPDVHQRAGLTCLDCHRDLHHGAATTTSCAACHLWRPGQPLPAPNLSADREILQLHLRTSNQLRAVPPARDPAHNRPRIDCAVCHAQWSFNDQETHLLRIDVEEYQKWEDLLVQGNYQAESQLLNSLYTNKEVNPSMTDTLSGARRSGLWLMLFRQRRWETPLLGRDHTGKLRVMRPSLDLRLSWIDQDGKAVLDAVTGSGDGLRPYTPHTIGKAGAFYRQRLSGLSPSQAPGRN